MPIDDMIMKAYNIIQKKRIENIGYDVYNVIGNHGTYIVARRIDGTVNCNCIGFVRRKRCSHSLAVLILNKPSLLRSIRSQINLLSNKKKSNLNQK